jgi:hypothetical protein
MASALKAFKVFHEHPDNIFALKDTILRSHHALETLFKDTLYQVNPVLLISKDRKVEEVVIGYTRYLQGKAPTVLDETHTTNLENTIERLRKLGAINLDDREYKLFQGSIKELCSYRNKLQHLGISANPDLIGRILGIVLPRGIDILDTISKWLAEKKFGFSLPINFGYPPLMESLEKMYNEAPAVIELLRNNYDSLVQEAIQFLSGKDFNNQNMELKIRDHGHVGAPPYFPELNLTGFFNYVYDMHSRIEWVMHRQLKKSPYEAKISIGEPSFEQIGAIPDYGLAKGDLELEANILLDSAEGFIVLPDAHEKIGMLRGVNVRIRAKLEYEAEALMNDWHFDVRKVVSANGKLTTNISAIPKGYTGEEMEITGIYQVNLNQENAPFRLHCFVEPGGVLSKHYSLEWNIRTTETLRFA